MSDIYIQKHQLFQMFDLLCHNHDFVTVSTHITQKILILKSW